MVHKPSKSSTTLAWVVAIFLAALTISSGVKILLSIHKETIVEPEAPHHVPKTATKPAFIDLQSIVDLWATTKRDNVGVYIYDLDNEKEAARYNSDNIFATASVYKLFFVYEAYHRISQGKNDPNAYFADGKTRIECLDLIIRESYNPCAESLKNELEDEIEDIITEKYHIKGTSDYALYATPKAVADMMKIYYNHEDISDELWAKISDSMLNQPATTYDWRMGLPSGFTKAKVYNKVGWDYVEDHWAIYNDAAIVEFPELNRHYVVVVLTKNTSNKDLAKLGSMLEDAIINYQ